MRPFLYVMDCGERGAVKREIPDTLFLGSGVTDTGASRPRGGWCKDVRAGHSFPKVTKERKRESLLAVGDYLRHS